MAILPPCLRPVTSLIHKLGANAFSFSTARTMSAQQSSEMVNQMVQFARTTCQVQALLTQHIVSQQQDMRSCLQMKQALTPFDLQEQPQQALDVLQTGLPHQDTSGQNRLYLAMAEIETGRSNWVTMPRLSIPVNAQWLIC